MKNRFSTLDIVAILPELQEKLRGARVNQVYDVDHKTYLIRFARPTNEIAEGEDETNKIVLLLESGIRFHTTDFAWPKNATPTGFTMKLRKHLKNKRLEHIRQLGFDRIIDIQFGSGEAAYHVILELYDRGNILITDYEWTILNILRVRKAGEDEDVKFMVREKYPYHLAKTASDYQMLPLEEVKTVLADSKPGDNLRKLFNPKVVYGAALLEHCFIEAGLGENAKARDVLSCPEKVYQALSNAQQILNNIVNSKGSLGYIIQKEDEFQKKEQLSAEKIISFLEFHPVLFNQHKTSTKSECREVESFDRAVDLFFSSIEGQKIDQKALAAEREALKKLEHVSKDLEKRVQSLSAVEAADERRATLIELNNDLVEKALMVMRSAVANQTSWPEIEQLLKEAQAAGNPVAQTIKSLDLKRNQFVMELSDPFDGDIPAETVHINLDLSAYANARKYYDRKKVAAKKGQKTVENTAKALKSAEQKTNKALKEVAIKTSIVKARRVYWFEKFFWAISSENYLIIAGRDAQQNEQLVKRYMKPTDVYVHADLHGASTVVVKNSYPGQDIPPRTLEEAAAMAICYSSAWEAKIVTRAWWVRPEQVSKTAPSGEYLTIGSFMIRGKKNYLPLSQLILGFGFLFKLDDESVPNHKDERRIKGNIDDLSSVVSSAITEEEEIELDNDDGDEDGEAEEEQFPDTRIRTISMNSGEEGTIIDAAELDGEILKPMEARIKKQKLARQQQHQQKPKATEVPPTSETSSKNSQLKRGQRSKQKKIKQKYKDQDPEEREIMMALLHGSKDHNADANKKHKKKQTSAQRKEQHIQVLSERIRELEMKGQNQKAGAQIDDSDRNEETQNDSTNQKNQDENDKADEKTVEAETVDDGDGESEAENNQKVQEADGSSDQEEADAMNHDESGDEEDENPGSADHVRLLDTFTGQPTAEDNLIFCIPVVAPYSSITNYKYKVKVMPGVARRGKAAKTALHIFTMDKSGTQREKDLLKSVKTDIDISRNLPNKIKITSANLQSAKKQQKTQKQKTAAS